MQVILLSSFLWETCVSHKWVFDLQFIINCSLSLIVRSKFTTKKGGKITSCGEVFPCSFLVSSLKLFRKLWSTISWKQSVGLYWTTCRGEFSAVDHKALLFWVFFSLGGKIVSKFNMHWNVLNTFSCNCQLPEYYIYLPFCTFKAINYSSSHCCLEC